MKLLIEVIFYVLAGVYGFLFSFFVLKVLQKIFFKSVKHGKLNPLSPILFMFASAAFLFLPALIGLRYFIATFLVAVITNTVLLIRLSKSFTDKQKQEDTKE